MTMISDVDFMLHAIRLSSLRITDDPVTPRIISLDPAFGLNPYITASGLSDIDRWPEITRALDSPPLEDSYMSGAAFGLRQDGEPPRKGLNYTQTIMGPGQGGGAGMRVSGRHAIPGESRRIPTVRANSSASVASAPISPGATVRGKEAARPSDNVVDEDFFSPSGRPRAGSAPTTVPLQNSPKNIASSILSTGRGMGVDRAAGLLYRAISSSQMSNGSGLGAMIVATPEEQERGSSIGIGVTAGTQTVDARMVAGMEDQGSDVDEEEAAEADVKALGRVVTAPVDSRRLSVESKSTIDHLDFTPVPIAQPASESAVQSSALTAALNKYIPHIVSTALKDSTVPISPIAPGPINPFYSLYSTVAAPPGVPSMTLELFFPHSKKPTQAISGKVRKDATVEEVTGYGLWKYWEEGIEPKLDEKDEGERWSTIGWGLRIVEDDGEVDEDFPPLDRESKIAKFSYASFAIVEATEAQKRQNAIKAPAIQRRPSRVLAVPHHNFLSIAGGTSRTNMAGPNQPQPTASVASSFSSGEFPLSTTATPATLTQNRPLASNAIKGSSGLSSTGSDVARLKVRVTVSADVHFTTTINVPSDMYIADLTEVLCKRKRLQMPATDWVLCLADLTLALPLDRTVASLEGRTDLALVKRTWAVEHGLKIDDRQGGDPSSSIFKRQSEAAGLQRFGPGVSDFSQTYKKFTVQRKIAIGRHERVLAIDGDYVHIMPSESRAFFDSMKTTSFHISLVAQCKLTGRGGGFKINVWRDGAQKRYEFEAENQRQAVDIVATIRQLMKTYVAERTALPPTRLVPARR